MVNKLKALAERVENYVGLAMETATKVELSRKMRAQIEADGMAMGLTRAAMTDMLPTLKEAALLAPGVSAENPAPTEPEPVTLSGQDGDPDQIDIDDYAGGPLVLAPADTFAFDPSETARTPEPDDAVEFYEKQRDDALKAS